MSGTRHLLGICAEEENYSKTIIAENNMSRFMCLLYILYLSLAQRDIALLCQRFTHGALAQNCGKNVDAPILLHPERH